MHEFFSIELSLAQKFFLYFAPRLVCYTAVFSVVTLRDDDTKNGCVADYPPSPLRKFSNIPSLKMCELNNEYELLTCFVNH